jgi:hypothetical protein
MDLIQLRSDPIVRAGSARVQHANQAYRVRNKLDATLVEVRRREEIDLERLDAGRRLTASARNHRSQLGRGT